MSLFNFWAVVAYAGVIAAIAIAQGHWTSSVLVALLFLVMLGAILPPFGALVGLSAIVVLLFRHGTDLFGKAGNLVQGAPAK